MKKNMLWFSALVAVGLLAFSFAASGNRSTLNSKESSYILDYRKGGKNVIDELYEKLVEKDETLQQHEKEMKNIHQKKQLLEQQWNSYNRYSSDYYALATSMAKEIQQENLKNKVLALLDQHKQRYSQTIENPLNKEFGIIQQQAVALEDYQNAFQILTTLQPLEEYQKIQKPSLQECNALQALQGEKLKAFNSKLVP
ncbi:MAG: hypothetical protein MUF42_04200 [Cytophagaceae bacterium]|jgi:hypothetical protein|nr:hypothetical protein [Cytophagaceae bacterium]